ncbi:MAG: MltA domain-containing protein [Elainellaceae cyanobacterium]
MRSDLWKISSHNQRRLLKAIAFFLATVMVLVVAEAGLTAPAPAPALELALEQPPNAPLSNKETTHHEASSAAETLPLRLTPVSELREQVERGEVVLDRSRLGFDGRIWGEDGFVGDRQRLLNAVDQSLAYLRTPAASVDYAEYTASEAFISGITRDRVRRSLARFRQLVNSSRSAGELQEAVQREFHFYQATGVDGHGTVDFTGYFEPTYAASRVPTPTYRYPLYRVPADLESWSLPHPTRADLEGLDGLQGATGRLNGLELIWLRDRLDAFLVQVQGSARLQLTDGSTMSVGYDGRTEYEYRSIGRMLIDDGIIPEAELTLPVLLDHFQRHPEDLNRYVPQNNRFIFFRETYGAPPAGSLDVPVTAERSIATDKTLMPPGALAVFLLNYPVVTPSNQVETRPVSRFVLDQDTGGAIRGAGRADIFMGTGRQAGERAGLINTPGELFYLLLRD